MRDALLGIDLGTTAAKVALFSPEDGRLLALSTQEYALETPGERFAELDAEVYWRAVVSGVGEVRREASSWRIASIGLSSQGQTFVMLDANHRPVRPAIVWLDTRGREEAVFLLEKLAAAAFKAHTGLSFPEPISSAPKILWVARHEPDRWRRTRHIAMLPEFIGHRLTGQFVCDPADMNSTGLRGDSGWWEEALRVAGIPREFFGEVKRSGELLGKVTPSAAQELGIAAEIPVGVGSNDQLTGAVGAGNVRPGMLSGAIGTAMAIIATLPGDARPGRLPVADHAVPGLKCSLAFAMTTGILLKWYRDTFEAGKSYDELVREGASAEIGANGLTFLPHFAGVATPTFDSRVRGGLVGLTLAHGRTHILRALLEAVGFTVRDAIELLGQSFGGQWETLRVFGGATRSAAWTRIIADIAAIPVEQPACGEAAVLGAAILGGVAGNLLPSIEEAAGRFYRAERVIAPGTDSEKYQEPYRRYRVAMENLYPGALGL